MFESNLSQLITCPTHVKGNILDLLLTNNENLISHLSASESTSFLTSDHFLISFYVEHTPSPTKRLKSSLVFDYINADYEGLCDFLFESDFSCCLLSDSIEQVWSFIILRGMNLFIPKVRVEDRKYPKWFNSKIIHTIKCLRTLRRKCSLNPTHNNSSKLLPLESHLTSLMNSAKLDFEKNMSTEQCLS